MTRLNRIGAEKIFTIFVLIMPILNIYSTPVISALRIGEVIGVFIIILLLAVNKAKFVITNKGYWIAIIYVCFISLMLTLFINNYSIGNTLVRIGRVLFYTYFAFRLAPVFWNWEYGKKVYIKLCVLTSAVLLLQFVVLQVFGQFVSFVIPNMNLSTNYATSADYYAGMLRDLSWYGKGLRVSGFFLEPAHFCEYVIFSLVFLLLIEKKKFKDWLYIVIITAAVAVSRSALGFFTLSFIYGIFVIKAVKKRKISSKRIVTSVIIIIVGIFAMWKFGLLEEALWRVATTSSEEATTGNLRLLRGFVIYNEMPILFKVFGMGFGNFAEFIETYNIQTIFDSTLSRTNEFMNSISVILVSGGIIGLTLYVLSLIKIFRI